jgi:O-antigen/teichoic acid export membrane protein
MWVYLAISFILVLIGFILYYRIDSIFDSSLTIEELEKAKIMFLILVFNLAITIPGGSFQAICNAYEEFVFPRVLNIFKYIIRAVCIFSILYMGGKAISLVVIDTVLNVGIVFISMIYVVKKLNVKISFNYFQKPMVKEIFSYSFWMFLFAITYQFQWNAGQVILGINMSTVTVAIFGVGVLLGGYYGTFAAGINGVLLPRATQMVTNNSNGKTLTEVMIKIGRINSYILFFILTGFFLIGKTFIFLWVGDEYDKSWIVAILIMIVMTLPLIQAFGNSILEAKKKNRFKSLTNLITIMTAVLIGFFLTKEYGIYGIIIPMSIAMALNNIIMNFYYRKIFDFQILYFVRATLLKPIIIYGSLCALSYFVLESFQISSWINLIVAILLYSIVFIATTYLLLMNTYEKSLINKKLR